MPRRQECQMARGQAAEAGSELLLCFVGQCKVPGFYSEHDGKLSEGSEQESVTSWLRFQKRHCYRCCGKTDRRLCNHLGKRRWELWPQRMRRRWWEVAGFLIFSESKTHGISRYLHRRGRISARSSRVSRCSPDTRGDKGAPHPGDNKHKGVEGWKVTAGPGCSKTLWGARVYGRTPREAMGRDETREVVWDHTVSGLRGHVEEGELYLTGKRDRAKLIKQGVTSQIYWEEHDIDGIGEGTRNTR